MSISLIVTRTRDRPQLLERAIQSVLHQTYSAWLHVIVNDGGDKSCVEHLKEKYSFAYDGRLHIVHNSTSQGMERASNIGIAQADSKYILIHDDDDSLDPAFLQRTIDYLESSTFQSICGVCTWANKIEERVHGNEVKILNKSVFRELRGGLSFADVCGINPVPPISFIFKRDAYNLIGPFDERLPVLGDWEFLLRFLIRFDVGVISAPLANYHIRRGASGALSNSIHEQSDQFALITKIIRNRFTRESENGVFGLLVQQGEQLQLLQRLYAHPVLGSVIRLWSRFVNKRIPRSPFETGNRDV